jgi:hypothetical protein
MLGGITEFRPFGYGSCLSLDQCNRPAGPSGPGHSSPQQAEGHPGWSSEQALVSVASRPRVPFIPGSRQERSASAWKSCRTPSRENTHPWLRFHRSTPRQAPERLSAVVQRAPFSSGPRTGRDARAQTADGSARSPRSNPVCPAQPTLTTSIPQVSASQRVCAFNVRRGAPARLAVEPDLDYHGEYRTYTPAERWSGLEIPGEYIR